MVTAAVHANWGKRGKLQRTLISRFAFNDSTPQGASIPVLQYHCSNMLGIITWKP